MDEHTKANKEHWNEVVPIAAGLRIGFLHEFPVLFHDHFSFMEKGRDGSWRLKWKKETIPMVFSLRATKSSP